MRVSVVAGLIVAVHVAVIGSVVMTQGCTSTKRGADVAQPVQVEPAPVPVLPPSATLVSPETVAPVTFPPIQPPTVPEPVQTEVAAKNVYVVKAGDSLSKIAARHGVNSRELAEINKIADANKIIVGQKLILPDYSKPSQSQPSGKAAAPAKPKAAVAGDAYEVKAGDSLSKIASAHGVKMKALMDANQIADANRIRIGQKLVIPGGEGKAEPAKADAPKAEPQPEAEKKVQAAAAPVEAAPAPAVVEPDLSGVDQGAMLDYTVQEGDTIEGIARLFVVRQDDIRRVNNIPAGTDVTPNQRIRIPPASSI